MSSDDSHFNGILGYNGSGIGIIGENFRTISMGLSPLRWDSLPSSYTVKRRWGDIQKQLGFKGATIRIITPAAVGCRMM